MIHNTSITDSPTAYVTVNRNRIKPYDNKVYLKDGTQFEIELWNPKTTRVLASISIDGKDISEKGLVLNPGQRVSIERWVDDKSPRKFKFSTYTVENTKEAKNAISNNGRVKIAFYDEVLKNFYPNGSTFGSIITNTPSWNGNQFTTHPYQYDYSVPLNGSINIGNSLPFGGTTVSDSFTLNSSNSSFYSNASYTSAGVRGVAGSPGPEGVVGDISEKTIETGMVGQGDHSNQSFIETTGDFNTWASKTWEWQILPESTKPMEAEKIRSYCTDCGTRVRATSWKYCPSCGEKLD